MTNTNINVGTLIEADPNTITLETNVRTEARLDTGFLDSIRANGVLTPVLGHRTPDGTVHVRAGQRRVLAARETGLTSIPVYLVDAQGEEADRIIQQLVENEQRDSMTDTDKVAAYKRLELEGLTVTAIAKRTGTKREEVKTSLEVAGNTTASEAISAHALTLDQAAVLMEFDGDQKVVAALIEAATNNPEQFAYNAQRARDDRDRENLRLATITDLTAKGFTILDDRPSWDDRTLVRIRDLATADGQPVTIDAITGLDGASAYVQVYRSGTADITYYLKTPKAHGFKKRNSGGDAPRGPMTDEEKAERKTIIENNKAWDAAETVRREWLTTFLSRKTLPQEHPQIIAELLTAGRHHVSSALRHGNALAANLLNITQPANGYNTNRFEGYLADHPIKAQHVALAITLGGIEENTGRSTWQHPSTTTARYLEIIADWGYPLTPVEKIAARIEPTTSE
ncbi:ParB/RepB/Spo0J family partition protein [Microbacterium sp. 179-I 3D4 NHS]|uniref:ParB/RepB/Spo0J family partition protein n=1 Tax=Microbacterium sp. 179-I 3D4 NHS TaxID=3142381 RepID=UPI0039A03A6C